MNELHSLVALTTIPLLGPVKIRWLVQHFGSAAEALKTQGADLADLPGFGAKFIEGWKNTLNKQPWWKEIELAERLKVQLVSWKDPLYPKRLLDIIDSPVLLYIKGELLPKDTQAIAVVGTRNPTIYGLNVAEQFGRHLAKEGYTVISGLARGIDTAAHRAALSEGRTVAVIGSGLAEIYPHENLELADRISHSGALISEFPMSTPPDRKNFPQRNRIVSGMSAGVLLIEAPIKSGAMITMENALAQNRKVFAIPGRIDSENYQGNHLWIKRGAQLVDHPMNVVESFENLFPGCAKPLPAAPRPSLEREEMDLLEKLPAEELTLEEIAKKVPLSVGKLNAILMGLILKRAIKEYPGKIYKKVMY